MTEDLAPRYIAFEGVEGSGKSTVSKRVADHIRTSGAGVVTVREPGGTSVGERIRQILLEDEDGPAPLSEAALFAASRAQLIHEVVKPALASGAWVVSDRSAYSSLAYQALGRGLGLEEIRELNNIAIDGVWPQRIVLLRLEATDGLARQAVDDRIGGEGEAFHRRVADAFDQLAAAEPDRFVVVDATMTIDRVVSASIEGLGL
jgi:dTMP kinase